MCFTLGRLPHGLKRQIYFNDRLACAQAANPLPREVSIVEFLEITNQIRIEKAVSPQKLPLMGF